MPHRPSPERTAATLGLLAFLITSTARADAEAIIFGALGIVAPADVGVAAADPVSPRLVIGWSYQIPMASNLLHHRIVPGFDLLPQAGPSWRGRLGYRYDRSHVFGGLGVGARFDGSGVNLSPELGVKFLQMVYEPDYGLEFSLHMLARAEIDPGTGHLRGATFMLGWNLL